MWEMSFSSRRLIDPNYACGDGENTRYEEGASELVELDARIAVIIAWPSCARGDQQLESGYRWSKARIFERVSELRDASTDLLDADQLRCLWIALSHIPTGTPTATGWSLVRIQVGPLPPTV
jgi:hypothetical protein